ncbi:transposase [bacterium]|nr:transposase [bacterium]
MARPLRVEFPGAVYHITSRGNARLPIFEHFNDKKIFLSILEQVIDRYHWLCHAYCLMDNHYHLLIETIEPNLSSGMRQLNGVYTQSYNRKYKKVGHLFQGRFKSILVEKEIYLLELCRYIVLNPVRADMVKSVDKYTWSSYRATSGLIKPPAYLTIDWTLNHFGKKKVIAQKKYKAFVNEGLNQSSPWEDLKSQCVLGTEQFIATLKQPLLKNIEAIEIPKQQRLLNRPSLEMLFESEDLLSKSSRNKIIQEAIKIHGYTQSELSNYLGLHYSTISRLLKKMSK